MKTNQIYHSPVVLRQVDICPQNSLLAASIVDKLTVESKGQDVVNYDYEASGNTFNHTWEN